MTDPILGLDVSAVQGKLTDTEWDDVASRGTRFVIARCGVGNNRPDIDWEDDIAKARARGLTVGLYFFFFGLLDDVNHPGRNPVDQARAWFAEAKGVGTKSGELPPCFDFEYPRPEQWGKPIPGVDNSAIDRGSLVARALVCLQEIERLWNRTPIVYGDPYMLMQAKLPSDFARYPLWLADYGPKLYPVYPWSGVALCQTSGGGGRLPSGAPVDTDACYDEDIFAKLIASPNASTIPAPPATPTP